ncbi:hypothetical protein WJX77_010830 [Trebouxia sp. C0004]
MGHFGYSALTPELLAMSQELEDLGGGDARIGKAYVCYAIVPSTPALSILQPVIGGLSVLDPRDAGASKHICKVFPLRAHIQGQVSNGQTGGLVGQAAAKWVLEGFNATLLAFGQSGAGKSSTLFGPQRNDVEPILPAVLHSLFNSCGSSSLRVGMSCWEIVQHEIADLLADSSHQLPMYQGGSLLTATAACRCVEAASAFEALSLLHLAQSNSSNWTSDEHGHLTPLPNRAHLFVRLVLYDTAKQQMSTLHVVDLAGSQSLADSCADRQQHQEKLAINQQLLGLSKVVSELSRLNSATGTGGRQVTSARDTSLMQLVAPLLAGNARTFLLAAVSAHPNSYLETVNTLRIAVRAQNIQMVSAAQVLAEERHRRLSAATTKTIRQGAAHQHCSNGHGSGESAACCPLINDCDQAPFASAQPCMQEGLPARLPQPSATQQWNRGLQNEPSFAFNRAVRPASALETKAAPYSSLPAAPAWAAPAGSEGSAGTAHGVRWHPAPAPVQPDMTSASQRQQDVSPAGADRPCNRQQQHWPGCAMPGHLDLTLRDDAAMPAPVSKAAQSTDAGVNDFAAYTPQELADHLQQLKKEFREIYSSILDGDSQSPCQVEAEGAGEKAGLCTAAGVIHNTCSGLGQDASPDAQHQASAVLDASEPLGLESDTSPAQSSRAFLDALRPRSPTERCSPGVAALAQRPMSGSPGRDNSSRQQDVADLRINNEALLCMLERERQHSHELEQRLQQVEADALERSLEQEVGLEEGRLAAISLRSKCRKLESESLFAEVFEKYEEEIRQLQDEAQLLKQSNIELSQQLASSNVLGPHPRSPLRQMPIPAQPAALKGSAKGTALQASPSQLKPSGQQNSFSGGQAKAASQDGPAACEVELKCEMDQGEIRLQSLRKQLKRSAAQCEALKAEVAELKRRDRTADLYKKKANDGVRRVSELQKEIAHCKQELQSCQQAAHQAANNMADLQGNNKFLEAEHIQALAANQDLQASVQTLREQVRLLRTQRQRSVLLAHLPPLRPEAQPPLNGAPPKCTALDIARRLQLEPAQTPKVAALVEQMAEETHMLSADRRTLQHREVILMELLTGHHPL